MKKNENRWKNLIGLLPLKLLLMMKLVVFIICFSAFGVLASTSYSQVTKLTIDKSNTSIKEILLKIEDDSEFYFLYNNELIDVERKVNIDVKNKKVTEVLDVIFEGQEVNYSIVDRQIVISPKGVGEKVGQQQKKVSGTVTDQTGQTLPGVTVAIKGTTQGVVTGSDGTYDLTNIADGAILVFSFVGMKTQEITVGNQTVIDLTMETDAIGLEEIVTIGYGTQRKKEVSGAVAQVAGEKLTIAPISTLTNTLTGRLAGLNIAQTSAEPGRESTSIMIRGASTFGNNSALIVIDGVANADGLDRLNPNEIESVAVLKDASAAIYGAQAANGVILITTKRGKTGAPQFNYSGDVGFNAPISLRKVSNALEYMTYINRQTWMNSGWDPNYTPYYSESEINDVKNGMTPTYEWMNAAYKDWFSQTNHNLSVRGGAEKIKYFVSGRYLKQGTIFEGDEVGGNKQYNLRSNLDFNFIDNLDIGLDISIRKQDVTNSDKAFAGAFQTAALTSPLLPRYVNDDPRYPAVGRAFQNPIAMFQAEGYNKNDRLNQTIIGNFKYRIPKLDGLEIGGFASAALASDDYKNFNKPWTYYIPNDDPTGTPIPQQSGIIRLQQGYSKSKLVTGNFNVKYVKSIGDHNIDALLQVEKQTYRADYYSAGNDDFLSPASDYFNSGSTSREASWVNGAASESARISYSGRANYNYKGKYMFQALFRYDGSEKFAEGQRFGFFPGVSAAWLISEEDFLKESSVLSSLKVKASWGQLGNDRIPAFNYLSRYVFGNNTVVDGKTTTGVRESGSSNPDVTWEVTESTNFGVEASINKLWFEVNLFDMQTKDILASPQLTLPQYTGIQPPQQNIGQHQNRGFEIELMYRDNVGEFSYAIGGNVSYTKNEIKFFDEPPYDEDYQNATGQPYGAPLIYHAIGIFRTQDELDNLPSRPGDRLGSVMIQDTNGDGEITIADRIRSDKTGMPDWVYGINGNLKYKNFDLDMLWQGTSGGIKTLRTIFSPNNNDLAFLANNTYDPNNIDAKYPAPGQGFDTDFYRLSSNYIRLKTLEIGYTIPQSITQKMRLNTLRIYFSGYNLLTFDNNSEIGFTDVEQTSDLGWDYPNLKTINFGVNVSF